MYILNYKGVILMKNFKKLIILGVWILAMVICINTVMIGLDIVISRGFAIENGEVSIYEAKMIKYYNSVNPITKSMADRNATMFSRVIVTLFGIFLPVIYVTVMNKYNAWKRKNRKARVN